mmetsp:Transcript_63465/g.77655  ORF Transcript_63465/g.77655 Transcript_63465/m.77655 type:complete len:363 (-) Transcript_63465:120-1208(-)
MWWSISCLFLFVKTQHVILFYDANLHDIWNKSNNVWSTNVNDTYSDSFCYNNTKSIGLNKNEYLTRNTFSTLNYYDIIITYELCESMEYSLNENNRVKLQYYYNNNSLNWIDVVSYTSNDIPTGIVNITLPSEFNNNIGVGFRFIVTGNQSGRIYIFNIGIYIEINETISVQKSQNLTTYTPSIMPSMIPTLEPTYQVTNSTFLPQKTIAFHVQKEKMNIIIILCGIAVSILILFCLIIFLKIIFTHHEETKHTCDAKPTPIIIPCEPPIHQHNPLKSISVCKGNMDTDCAVCRTKGEYKLEMMERVSFYLSSQQSKHSPLPNNEGLNLDINHNRGPSISRQSEGKPHETKQHNHSKMKYYE